MPIRLHFDIAFVKNIAYYAASRGVDVERLCQIAAVPRHLLSEPDARVGAPLMNRVWQAAVQETEDANFGIHLGEGVQPADIGIVGMAMMSCDTLQSALRKLIRYWDLMSNATQIELSASEDTAILELRVIDIPGNFLLENRHPVESSLSACLSLIQVMLGQPFPVLDVASEYPAPGDVREHVRIFGRKPRFGAGLNTITFPAEVMRWPLRYANPLLVDALEEQMRRRVQQKPVTLQGRVRLEVARRLRAEVPNLKTIAVSLGVSERAMQRNLQTEGTTFRMVVDDLRKDLAAAHLAEGRHSITDISFLLGFSEPSVLHRYFRRWFGMSPAMFRREQLDHQLASESRQCPEDSTTPAI